MASPPPDPDPDTRCHPLTSSLTGRPSAPTPRDAVMTFGFGEKNTRDEDPSMKHPAPPTALTCAGIALLVGISAAMAADGDGTAPVPVPVSMHDFMEGVFQAPYRRLKISMAEAPKEPAGWKALRSDALILAEGGNLLLHRLPDNDADLWVKFSTSSRDAGAEVVKAAKAKDFPGARKAYELMLNHCNDCHRKFENGKHILEP